MGLVCECPSYLVDGPSLTIDIGLGQPACTGRRLSIRRIPL